jgi:hypothetical protein
MIIQLSNVVSGFILAAPKLKTLAAKEHVEQAESKLNEFRGTIGLIELVIGVVALLQRMGIVYFYFPLLGSSYPQALIAIAIGLILSANFFEKWPSVHEQIDKLENYGEWIGVLGIAVGLLSLI